MYCSKSVRKASSMTSSKSLCCRLLCTLAFGMASGAKAFGTARDAEEATLTGVHAACTEVENSLRARLAMGPHRWFCGSLISRYKVSKGKRHSGTKCRLALGVMATKDADRLLRPGKKNLFDFLRVLFRNPLFFQFHSRLSSFAS